MIINSLEYYQKAYDLSQELDDPQLTAELAISEGNAHQQKGTHDQALKSYFEAIESFSKTNRKDMLAIVYDKVAAIYRISSRELDDRQDILGLVGIDIDMHESFIPIDYNASESRLEERPDNPVT